ncbi:sulfotransferase family 2 domain-containing protein [Halomonadaceae bacterium KBTZ08]
MIINDTNKLAFLHIPKCAGTSVRNSLAHLDEREGLYTGRVAWHSELGFLDYVHIPLFTLHDYFFFEYKKIAEYWSLSVIRDPFERFPSSLTQHLKMYGEKPIQKLTQKGIMLEIDKAIDYLSKSPQHNHQLPAEYIHFQKQSDYVYLNDKPIIESIYTVNELNKLIADINNYTDNDVNLDRSENTQDNQGVIHRSIATQFLIETTRPLTRLFSKSLSTSTKKKVRSFIYVARDERLNSLFSSNHVKDFVRDYYKKDIELWENTIKTNSSHRE